MANEKQVIYVNDFIEHYCSDCKYFQSNGICHKENPLCTNVRLALQLAAKLPTVDAVKVVHGRWVRKAAYNDGVLNTVACSECGAFQPVGCWDYYDYCPHCGAKMDGGNEDG